MLINYPEEILKIYEYSKVEKCCYELKEKILITLSKCSDKIPCFIVSFNNGVYIKNIVKQLAKFNIIPIIIDNNSHDKETCKILKKMDNLQKSQIVFSSQNLGHKVCFFEPIYEIMPDFFAYSDPDLQFNQNLPHNFLNILAELTIHNNVFKVGFALDLLPNEPIINASFLSLSIREWEAQFWIKKIPHQCLSLYSADIDTTFAVYKKSSYQGNFYHAIRVAGNYTAIHLPWFPNRDLFTEENRRNYLKGNISTNWTNIC